MIWSIRQKLGVAVIVAALNILFILKNVGDSGTNSQPKQVNIKKYILIYTITSVYQRHFNISSINNIFSSCPVSNCLVTRNSQIPRYSQSEFDAIIFLGQDLSKSKPSDMPDQELRRMTQRYIFYQTESPINWKFNYTKLDDLFNWTMSYKLDSDIHIPYGNRYIKSKYFTSSEKIEIKKSGQSHDKNYFNYNQIQFSALAHRPGAVAWMASHCNTISDREKYVNELMKHIQVDIFGGCSNVQTKFHSCIDCQKIIKERYKFYLAFENSLCDDYVTEKLFQTLTNDVVPVVMGQADYAAITPPHSIINALDFPEPKYLAAYLNQLLKNDTEYLSYYWWKIGYYVENKGQSSWCRLCQMLNDPQQQNKVYNNFGKWWSEDSHCRSKGQHPWSKYKRPSFSLGKY